METSILDPIVAAGSAVVTDAAAAAVSFSLINSTESAALVTVAVAILGFGAVIANSLHHVANNLTKPSTTPVKPA